MRYVQIDPAVPGPQRVMRLIEVEEEIDGVGYIDVTERPDVGAASWYSAEAGDFVDAPPPTPAEPSAPAKVTMRQARLALLGAGLLDDVEGAIEAMGDTPEGKAARIEWDYSSEVFRHKPFVQQIGNALGLTEEQIDQLFITAAGIE